MSEPVIRPAGAGDEEIVCVLLRELAEYERLDHRFRLTPDIVRRDFLGASPRLDCALAFSGDQPAGVMTSYPTYSSFAAQRGIYLEDFYVRSAQRRQGIGRKLLAHLAKRALADGAARIEWSVLTWNEPSIRFYENLHAERVDEWHIYRLAGRALDELAAT
jgi:GNAT superfamily N-acetyltransferase